MQDGWITAGFNALNQPMYIWSANVGWTNFGYDPLGRCVKRANDTGAISYLYYDGWNLIQEGPSASTPDRIYIHGARIDQILCSYQYSTGAALGKDGEWHRLPGANTDLKHPGAARNGY
jgi:hypothetical protein